MRVIIQRVREASVTIEDKTSGQIRAGLLVLAGWEEIDSEEDLAWTAGKIARLRIFNDEQGLMNLSVQDVKGDILLVSQFTLYAATRKGNRPSFIRSAKPDIAIPLYERFKALLALELGKDIQTGEFGAYMKVSLLNDGPVTIFIDSKDRE